LLFGFAVEVAVCEAEPTEDGTHKRWLTATVKPASAAPLWV